MPLFTRFNTYISERNLFEKKDLLILAISGGIDSVVLTELCHKAGYRFVLAHCNFQLRNEESFRDEDFVRALSEKYKVTLFIKRFDTQEYAARNKTSIQVAARELRYTWFANLSQYLTQPVYPFPSELGIICGSELIMKEPPATDRKEHFPTENVRIITAHHANDNVETLLMNFFKGTGIKGLQGILPKQGQLIRPLLFGKKEELIDFAEKNNLLYVEDSSNFSNKYTRNYFRNEWLPAIKKIFPGVENNLIQNIERFGEIDILYRQAVQQHRTKLVEYKGNEIHIPILKLLRAKPVKTLLYEILKDYGYSAHQTVEVYHLLQSETGRYIVSTTHRAFRNRKWLVIAPLLTKDENHIFIEKGEEIVEYPQGLLCLKKLEKAPADYLNCPPEIAVLDSKSLVFPLLLRKWKPGDYFYPLGLKTKKSGKPGKKKLSRYFIDRKFSLTEKEKIWVLESNKRIVWIPGERLDERFKITPGTKSFLSIRISKSEKSSLDRDSSLNL